MHFKKSEVFYSHALSICFKFNSVLLQHLSLSSSDCKPVVWSNLKLTWLQMLDTISIDTCFLVHVTAHWFTFLLVLCKWSFSHSYSPFKICNNVLSTLGRERILHLWVLCVFFSHVSVFPPVAAQEVEAILSCREMHVGSQDYPTSRMTLCKEAQKLTWPHPTADCPNSGLFCWRSFYVAGALNKSQNLRVGCFVSPKMDAFIPSVYVVLPVK